MALGTDYLGKHTRHAFYVAAENPDVDRWRGIFEYIQDGNVESMVTALSSPTKDKGNSADSAPGSEPSGCIEVELFGYQSIVAHAAAFSNRCLEYLLSDKGGCDSNIRSSGAKDQTPLFNARGECIATLLAHGADPCARDIDGETVFTAAIKRRNYDQAVDYLRYGLKPDATDSVGNTALYIAAAQEESFEQEPFWDEFFGRYCVRQPFEIPALLNKKCFEGTTCLHAAAAGKRVGLVRQLLFWGADPSMQDDRGNLPDVELEWKKNVGENTFLSPSLNAQKKDEECLLGNRDVIVISTDDNCFPAPSHVADNLEKPSNQTATRHERRTDGSPPPQSPRADEKERLEVSSGEEVSSEEDDEEENVARSTHAKVLSAAREAANQKIQAVDGEYNQLTAEAQKLKDEFDCLKNENVAFEARLASQFASLEDLPLLKTQKGTLNVVQYTSSLLVLDKAYSEYHKARKAAAEKEESVREQLELRRTKLRDCQVAFRNFLSKVAKNSRMSQTGKPIPDVIIQQLLRLVEEKTATISQSRETVTTLKHHLYLLQADASTNHAQDQFHVMDFEQLKIENQALNEKIVEKNEEIRKLQSIVVSAVQFNTHWREKIHFLIHANAKATQELARLDKELAIQRELVSKSKKERDEYRAENNKLRQQTDMINSEVLTADWEKRQQRKQELGIELAKLQQKFRDVTLEKATLLGRSKSGDGAVSSCTHLGMKSNG